MNKTLKKVLIVLGIFAALIVIGVILSRRDRSDFHDKYADTDLSVEVEGMERVGAYTGYLNEHASDARPTDIVDVDVFDYSSTGTVKKDSANGIDGLLTDTGSSVTWKVNVPKEGMYQLYIEYYIPESRGVAAERSVYINGELPFEDARNIAFTRMWMDGGDVKVDNQGNEIRPRQIEYFDWQSAYFKDDMGFVKDPYIFYFNKGENELTLVADNEPMIISSLSLKKNLHTLSTLRQINMIPGQTQLLITFRWFKVRTQLSDRNPPYMLNMIDPHLLHLLIASPPQYLTMWVVRAGETQDSGSNGVLRFLRMAITT